MKKLVVIVASAVAMLGFALAPMSSVPVYAAGCDGVSGTKLAACSACIAEEGATWESGKCNSSSGDMNGIIKTIINIMLFIIGILSVVMIIFGGIRYVTSTGDKGKVDGAKNTIIYAVVGLVVAMVAFALVNWVFGSLSGK